MPPNNKYYKLLRYTPPDYEWSLRFKGTENILDEGIEAFSSKIKGSSVVPKVKTTSSSSETSVFSLLLSEVYKIKLFSE